MSWRVARSLLTLRDQIDQQYPDRDRASDGTIGDADHRTRESDHNPHYQGHIVTALDITHDPDSGVDIDRLTDELAASRDPRIKYIIANDLIMSGAGGPSPWVWRDYGGSNPHARHFHLSVVASPLCDDPSPWNLPSLTSGGGGAAPGTEDDMALDEKVKLWNGTEVTLRDLLRDVQGRTEDIRRAHYGDGQTGGLHDPFGVAVFTDNPGTDRERVLRMRDVLGEYRTRLAGLVDAVAALSHDPALTAERVEQIMRDAVAQHVEITGEVHIGPAPGSEGNQP